MAQNIFRTLFAIIVVVSAARPAYAQFGWIFGDDPPRPPANVPNRAPRAAPPRDEPPAQPLPAPMSLPPSSRPGLGGVQSQPLPPPPGGTQAPAQARQSPNAAPPPAAGVQPSGPTIPGFTPGLPPGQRQPTNVPPQQANTAPPENNDEVVVQPPEQRLANPTAIFAGLDKITGRTITFDVAINETVQFGALQVTPRACYSRPPTETQRTDAFVAVDEVTLQGEVRRIFTGWMFAASPGLHAVEHPIYDVWLTDCKGALPEVTAQAPQEAPAKPAAKPAPRKRTAPAARPAQPGFLPGVR